MAEMPVVGKLLSMLGFNRERKPQTLELNLGADELAAADDLLSKYVREISVAFQSKYDPKDFESGRLILDSTPQLQLAVLLAAMARILGVMPRGRGGFSIDAHGIQHVTALRQLSSALLRRNLPWNWADLTSILNAIAHGSMVHSLIYLPIRGLLRAVTSETQKNPPPPELRQILHLLRDQLRGVGYEDGKELASIIDEMLGNAPTPRAVEIEAGEAWADAAIEAIEDAPDQQQAAWQPLLKFCHDADGSKPSKKWLKQASALLAAVGEDVFRQRLAEWLPMLSKPRNATLPAPGQFQADANLLITEANAAILKGLAWACADHDDPILARALADAALACFKKIPNHGPRSAKVGNACLFALSAMPTSEAAAQLARVSAVIKQPTGKKMAAKALTSIGQRTGQSAEDLAELALPNYGLGEDGKLQRQIGSFAAELRITGSTDTQLTWTNPTGKKQTSIPAEIKRDHSAELKDLQRIAKDIEKMLPAQRARLERLLLNPRQWPFQQWRERYLDHPLLCNLARRLIWQFKLGEKSAAAIWLDGDMVDPTSCPIDLAREGATVTLWHPIESSVDAIRAWREFLQEGQISQPFKQAHREIYILTDAERQTNTYSNRFAGHIIRQHQFLAICQQRGWKSALQGGWDPGEVTPTLQLPQWQMRAEYWNEMAEGGGLNDMGVAMYLATDQVRFIEATERGPMPLANVPPRVFSEVMRDVDLFVAVCSVGNDPQWRDAGDRTGDYWHRYSFGDLGETAKTRKAVLERLIPRLKIADRCSLRDKFLVVRGDLRTYKIHLGSGNILMEPNDQYLCIVPDRSTRNSGGDVFLPFEGDSTLSVIISKAFLLASDQKITDPTILRQIK